MASKFYPPPRKEIVNIEECKGFLEIILNIECLTRQVKGRLFAIGL